jgi:hypothetical protein
MGRGLEGGSALRGPARRTGEIESLMHWCMTLQQDCKELTGLFLPIYTQTFQRRQGPLVLGLPLLAIASPSVVGVIAKVRPADDEALPMRRLVNKPTIHPNDTLKVSFESVVFITDFREVALTASETPSSSHVLYGLISTWARSPIGKIWQLIVGRW